MPANPGIVSALAAAVLFGLSSPLAKLLLGHLPPVALAGLLYLGSGIGLLSWWAIRHFLTAAQRPVREATLRPQDLPWLAGAILSGGVAAPVLLMVGLSLTPAASASLLLNLEGVLTALFAWFVFGENLDRRVVAGMGLITLAGLLLSWGGGQADAPSLGSLAVVAACLGWAVDNNLTQRVSASDPVQIAGIKGLVAGLVNLGIAAALGWPTVTTALLVTASVVGLLGYGVSLTLFVTALRHIGAARTSAYFSLAPFIGAASAIVLLRESPGAPFWIAAVLMGVGIWLYLTERHEHLHRHEGLVHTHPHEHDAHHRHTHSFAWDGREPHSHPHTHGPLVHSHPHYPDLHHRHRH